MLTVFISRLMIEMYSDPAYSYQTGATFKERTIKSELSLNLFTIDLNICPKSDEKHSVERAVSQFPLLGRELSRVSITIEP